MFRKLIEGETEITKYKNEQNKSIVMARKKPKIGIALGAGAVRGMAHIGILKVLEENGFEPDYVTGTSIGAIIGAFYASGRSPEWIERFVLYTRWKELLDFTIPNRGFLEGRSIEASLQRVTRHRSFDDIEKPLRVVATDITNNEKVVFKEGNVAKATRASMSIPGVFDPVEIHGKKLVDGAMVDPIPTEDLKEMGADIVIAVDLSINIHEYYMSKKDVKEQGGFTEVLKEKLVTEEIRHLKTSIKKRKFWVPRFLLFLLSPLLKPKKILRFMTGKQMPEIIQILLQAQDMLGNQLSKEKLKNQDIDVVIKPKFKGVKWAEFDKTNHCIQAGEIAALRALPDIKKAIRKFNRGKKASSGSKRKKGKLKSKRKNK